MSAFFGPVKHTAVGTHLFQKLILLKGQNILLEKIHLSLGSDIIHLWKDPGDMTVVFLIAVTVADPSLFVCHKLKSKYPVLIGGKLPAKILIPGRIVPIGTDDPFFLHPGKILFCDPKSDPDLNIGKIFQKILQTDLIIAAECPNGIQNRCLPCVVLPHQNQRILNIRNMNIFYGFEIPNLQVCDLHNIHLPRISSL